MSDAHTTSALPPPSYSQTDEKVLPIAVYVLYLLGFASGGLSTVVGLIMAYVLRTPSRPVAATHYTFLIGTFWISVVATIVFGLLLAVGIPLSVVIVGLPMVAVGGLGLCAVTVWFVVRCIVGLIRAAQDEPYPAPRSWML